MAFDHHHSPSPPARAHGELVRAGEQVELRRHTPDQRTTFVRWYRDAEIAGLLRHDLAPLTESHARAYFDSVILPASVRGACWALHERDTRRLIGSTAIVDINEQAGSSLFRLVIGEKEVWGRGYGTEATKLVLAEAFLRAGLQRVNLEVFAHNPRALRAYARAGFRRTGHHTEWVARARRQIDVIEMTIAKATWLEVGGASSQVGEQQGISDTGADYTS